MTPVRRTEYEQLSRAESARVDAACDRFERAWKAIAANAEPPDIRPYCADLREPERTVLAWELMALDRVYRERRGETRRADAYRGLCAEYDEQLSQSDSTNPLGPEDRHVHAGIGPNLPGMQITQVLGSGGMGIVYKAWQPALGRYVAVKMLRGASLADREQRERFEREARSVARLQHPNMVQVYAFGETQADDGTDHVPYFVLEYVSGGSLADFLKGTPQQPRAAGQLVETLARAICHVHDQGIIHRDLKPANILLSFGRASQTVAASALVRDERLNGVVPKITDFGLAKLAIGSDLTRTGDTLGTPSYMAPEQIDGTSSAIGPATDVYGLGAVLYEMLTGRPPFQGETPLTTVLLVSRDDPVSPLRLQPTVPLDLETICMKCLQKDPRARYANAQALANDLRRFLDGRPIEARPVGSRERLMRWCRRNPRVAGLLILVGVLVLVVLVGAPLAAVHLHNAREQALLEKWDAYREAAAARRSSQQSGQRFLSLTQLTEAAQSHQSLALRNEAIACMALPDLHTIREWDGNPAADATVAFDSELKRYAAIETDGRISVRHLEDHQELCILTSPDQRAILLPRFSPDGRFLAALHDGKEQASWQVWDLSRQQVIGIVPVRKGADVTFDFRPDGGGWLVGQPDGRIGIYEVGSGDPVQILAAIAGLTRARFRPGHRQLALGNVPKQTVEVRDFDTDQIVAQWPVPAGVHTLAWSRDGKLLAAGCDDFRVYIWNIDDGRQHVVLDGHRGSVSFLAFHPDGDLLVSSSWDDTSRLWDVRTGRHLVRAPGVALGFSPDGNTLAFRNGLQVGLWKVSTGQECRTLLHGPGGQRPSAVEYPGPRGVGFSADGRLLASANGDGVRLWDLTRLKELAHLPIGPTDTVRFHPTAPSVFTFGRTGLYRWPLEPDVPVLADHLRIGPPQVIRPYTPSVRFHLDFDWDQPAESIVATADATKSQAIVFPIDRPGEPVVLQDVPYIDSVALSPDGRWAAVAAGRTKGVTIFDAATGALVKRFHGEMPEDNGATVTFSPDGRWLVTGGQRDYRFWSVGSWTPGMVIKRERSIETKPGRMAFTSDGRQLAIAWSTQTVRLLDPATGVEVATLTPLDPWPITRLCFSPDSGQLAVATEHHVIHLWDLRRIRQQLAAMKLDWQQPVIPELSFDQALSVPLQNPNSAGRH